MHTDDPRAFVRCPDTAAVTVSSTGNPGPAGCVRCSIQMRTFDPALRRVRARHRRHQRCGRHAAVPRASRALVTRTDRTATRPLWPASA